MKSAIEFVLTGECKIDVEQVVKKWNLLCRICKYNESYTLVEYTPKGRRKLKVAIRKDDALKIIEELHLRGVESEILNNSVTYLVLN